MADDPHDLARFLAAQEHSFDTALGEIRRGRKHSHWMWYIFPQIAGLGRSATAQHYALQSLGEARAYLAHPVLGTRLLACITALQALEDTSAVAVFGPVDAMKLHSSLTLFERAGGGPLVAAALDRWFNGARDPATLAIVGLPA